MTLFVSVLGLRPRATIGGVAQWGAWQVLPLGDPTVLAEHPGVHQPDIRHVLLLTPTSEVDRARIAAATIGAVRPDLAVRVEPVPASPAALVRAVERVPSVLTKATAVHASIGAALTTITWGAWLASVARLDTPSPSLGQHVSSWFTRGAGFLGVHGSPGWVGKLPMSQVDPSRRLQRPHGGHLDQGFECHAFGELPEHAIAALFSMGLTTRPVRREPVADVKPAWGTAKAVEFVINPVMPIGLPAPSGLCPACSEPVIGAHCPFCRVAPTVSRRVALEPQGAVR
ncbi:hypothetical protein [Nocardioides sp. MH1]|uniref:hypothetical protein n=1 Tax=Nocardioides sp. MH1 TaxID=3242490 RepID=UPI0035201C58